MSEMVLQIVVNIIGIQYTLTFDVEGILDTVVRDGKQLSSKNVMVKRFVTNQHSLFNGINCGILVEKRSLIDSEKGA